MKDQTLLITGANGFTGRHACDYFASKGNRVVAAIRRQNSLPAISGVDPRVCDLTVKNEVLAMVDDISPDFVLHLAGKNSVPESWNDPLLYMEKNVLSTLTLLDALRNHPECRILIVGSRLKFPLVSFPYSPHPYSLSKTLEECAVLSWRELFHQHILLAEPSNLIGPGSSTGICALLARHIVNSEQGRGMNSFRISSRYDMCDFVDVRDAILAYDLILRKGESGRVYPICSGIECSLGDVVTSMLELGNVSIVLEMGNAPQSSSTDDDYSCEDLHEMGWKPQIPWEQSLVEIMEYFRNGGGKG
ncbi:GDP-4-dehydro-6-deoxy-D-mannose reductase [Paenibacillus sp. DS2015]|uniref:NAD-dependent epimerase/dehydratase family protein n=1 Tax=Paenibacillus sp. DS2015 TaxID=3373917 RepID=UPI003D23B6F8